MTSFREQMQDLADELIRARAERKNLLEKNRRDAVRRYQANERQRKRTVSQDRRERVSLINGLKSQHARNHSAVKRMLSNLAQSRRNRAAHLKTTLERTIQRNRSAVASMLEVCRLEREAEARQQVRAAADTLSTIKQEVSEIRDTTRSMLNSYAQDLRLGRRAWARALSR